MAGSGLGFGRQSLASGSGAANGQRLFWCIEEGLMGRYWRINGRRQPLACPAENRRKPLQLARHLSVGDFLRLDVQVGILLGF